jgi:hypothetical protein
VLAPLTVEDFSKTFYIVVHEDENLLHLSRGKDPIERWVPIPIKSKQKSYQIVYKGRRWQFAGVVPVILKTDEEKYNFTGNFEQLRVRMRSKGFTEYHRMKSLFGLKYAFYRKPTKLGIKVIELMQEIPDEWTFHLERIVDAIPVAAKKTSQLVS